MEDQREGKAGGLSGWVAERAGEWDLSGPDEATFQRQKFFWNVLVDYWFRMEIDGWEHIPDPPALLVGIHSGAPFVWDAWTVGQQWWRRFGQERPLHGTAHDALMAIPLIGRYFRSMGVLPAAPDAISTALAEGRDVALWPGGEVDSLRPWAERYGGSAVATRWPHRVLEALDLRLSEATDVPWCTLAVSVPLPGEGDLLFLAATASWRLDAESARERQALALTDLDARHRGALPTIIAGDFNATPDAASIRYLTGLQSLAGRSAHYHDAWAVAGDGPGHTWTVDNPNTRDVIDQIVRQPNHRRRVDYVFTGSWHAHPKAHCRIRAATLAFDRPVDGVWPSDHLGVVVDVEIGNDS